MNNFELTQRLDEALRQKYRQAMVDVFNETLGVNETIRQWNDMAYAMIDDILSRPIGGHGAYSPYNEPLVQAMTLSDMTKNDAERAVRRTLME